MGYLVGLALVWYIRSGFQEFSQPRGRLSNKASYLYV